MSEISSNIHSKSPQDKAVSLAHISDPHLPLPKIPAIKILNKRAFSLALWMSNRKQHHLFENTQKIIHSIQSHHEISSILVTGDLTNFGTKEEFISARNWLESFSIPPIIVPGNHDTMMPEQFENSIALWKPWTGPDFPFVKFIKNVAIIGLNSAIPTPLFKAYGRLGPQQLEKLSFILEHLGKAGYCRIVMLHHPPKTGLMDKVKALKDVNEFSSVIQEKGAELVLHGHSHNATFTHVEGCSVPLLGSSSVSMKDKRHSRKAGWTKIGCIPSSQNWEIQLTRYDETGQTLWAHKWQTDRQTATSQQRPVF